MIDIQGKVALVSGGSRGIGAAICRSLAAAGATVVVNYHQNAKAAEAVVGEIQVAGGRAEAYGADVSWPGGAGALVHGVTDALGPVDILVHNAGVQHSAMAHKMTDDQWQQSLALNLSAAFYLSRAVLPPMRAAGAGCIVFIASASASVAQAGAAGYVAAKHGLVGLTKALAMESAPKGIRVNAVSPGLTETDMVSGLSDEQRYGLLGRVPMRRMATPEEIAATVEWVVRGATYATGNVFHASGGAAMG